MATRERDIGLEILEGLRELNWGAVGLVVPALSPEDLAQFRVWFAEFEAALWDRLLDVNYSCAAATIRTVHPPF